ncbi:MAG: 3'-5' exonuclease [Bacilli bacterium]
MEFEDLAALLYLKFKLQEPEDLQDFKHVVIDEAQDFGDFNFYALKQIMPKSSFSIFGDLTQSIYQYRGIDNWNSVITNSFDQNCNIKYLLKSYRTTTEIMNSANHIIAHIGMKKAEPVIRHGECVKYIKTENEQLKNIVRIINDNLEEGYKSIAVITKTEKEADFINKQLKKIGMNIENINSKNSEYNGGICTIPCYLSKGLEFDSVIISDASEEQYNSNKLLDMKLLYVAMTRALHELVVLYNNQLTLPLAKQEKIEKETVKIKSRIR